MINNKPTLEVPKRYPKQYFCNKKADSLLRTKVCRFSEPIVVAIVKHDVLHLYQRAHISFQSTSPCNISTFNALNSCKFSLHAEERGQNKRTRSWVIEMNNIRALYLTLYGIADCVGQFMKFLYMQYCSWKYWHTKTMVGVVSYDMYVECCKGNLDTNWKSKKLLAFWQSRDRQGQQLLSYNPRFRHYPGYDHAGLFTTMNKDKWKKKASISLTNSQDQPQKKKGKLVSHKRQAFEPKNDDSISRQM